MSVFLSDGTYHSAEEYILLYVQYQTIFTHSSHDHVAVCRLTWAACDRGRSNFVKSVSFYNRA